MGGPVRSRLRHRAPQAVALVLLAALLTAGAGLAPLYQRAIEQALAATTLDRAEPSALVVTAGNENVEPEAIVAGRPSALAPYLDSPVLGTSVRVSATTDDGVAVGTRLRAVDGACEHLELLRGRCPSAPGEVMVSADDQRIFDWGLGSTRTVSQVDPLGSYGQLLDPRLGRVEIVGVYTTVPGEEWAGDVTLGRALSSTVTADPRQGILTDDWITVPGSITGAERLARWTTVTATAAWPLRRSAVDDVEDLLTLGRDLDAYTTAAALAGPGEGDGAGGVEVSTTLPELASGVDRGRTQSRDTVTAFAAQVLLLVLVVFVLVAAAAVEQRRPEVALARLRGRGRRGATSYLLAELVPLVVLGVVLGGVAALGGAALLARLLLPTDVPVEAPRGFLLAWLAVGLGALAVVGLLAARTARTSMADLLRAVPARGGVAGLLGEVAVLVFAGTTVAVFLTGTLTGALAAAAPALLALVVGVLLARAARPVGALLGRVALARGRPAVATGLLQASRRPATRRVVVLVVLATSVFVFSGVALETAQRNRTAAADQAAGAPVALSLAATGPSAVGRVVDAVRAADPDRSRLTPVVTASAPGGGPSTVAVDPVAFATVARFPLVDDVSDLGLDRVLAPDDPSLVLRGRDLSGRAAFDDVVLAGAGDVDAGGRLVLQLLVDDGTTRQIPLTVTSGGTAETTWEAGVPCARGCEVIGLTVTTSPAVTARGEVRLADLSLDGAPVDLGPPSDWRPVDGDDGRLDASAARGGLRVRFATAGTAPAALTRTWVPQPLEAIVTQGSGSGPLQAVGLGSDIAMAAVGRVDRVPAAAADTRLVDVEALRRLGDRVDDTSLRIEVWSGTTDPGVVDGLERALARRGVGVVSTRRLTDVERDLDDTPAAWSLDLAGPAGTACLLLAVLVLVVVASTTRPARTADLGALRESGTGRLARRRVAVVEQVPAVLLGVLAGVGCGLVGAHLALPSVRLFTTEPVVSTVDLHLPWPLAAALAGTAVVVLGGTALLTGRGPAGDPRPARAGREGPHR